MEVVESGVSKVAVSFNRRKDWSLFTLGKNFIGIDWNSSIYGKNSMGRKDWNKLKEILNIDGDRKVSSKLVITKEFILKGLVTAAWWKMSEEIKDFELRFILRPELRQSSLCPALSPLYCLTDGRGRFCYYYLRSTRRSRSVASDVEKIELVGHCENAVRKARIK